MVRAEAQLDRCVGAPLASVAVVVATLVVVVAILAPPVQGGGVVDARRVARGSTEAAWIAAVLCWAVFLLLFLPKQLWRDVGRPPSSFQRAVHRSQFQGSRDVIGS